MMKAALSTIDFGGKLRQARERRGVSLRQIAANTKISVAALEALERNDVSRLPGGIFSRAFVRSYATEVGLDPDDTVREFLERFHGEAPPPPAATQHVTPSHHHAPTVEPIAEDESAFESQQRMAKVLLKIVLVSVAIAGIIFYFTLRSRPLPAPDAVEREQPPAAPPGPVASLPQDASPAAASTAVTPPATSTAPAAPAAGEPMTLVLHPTDRCWVSLTVDGERILAREMEAGERQTVQIGTRADLQVGNAGAFAYTINGRPGRPLGAAGEVKTARITRETIADYVR
jgi:cytoskeletal protein RodZ